MTATSASAATSASTGTTRRVSPLKVATASFVGTAIEWYDYFIYGMAAAIVFGPLFFPSFSPSPAPSLPSRRTPSDSWPARSAAWSWGTSAIASAASPCWSPRWS